MTETRERINEREHTSRCGTYRIVTASLKGPGSSRSVCEVYRRGELFATLERNLTGFVFELLLDHPTEHDYLIFSADYQGYSVLDLSTGERADYVAQDEERGFGWCPGAFGSCPEDATLLAVEGGYWGCPDEVRIFDVREPMVLPWPVLHQTGYDIYAVKGWAGSTFHWEDDVVYSTRFECLFSELTPEQAKVLQEIHDAGQRAEDNGDADAWVAWRKEREERQVPRSWSPGDRDDVAGLLEQLIEENLYPTDHPQYEVHDPMHEFKDQGRGFWVRMTPEERDALAATQGHQLKKLGLVH